VDTTPPGRSPGKEIAARIAEAALGSVPVAGNALAVTFVTVLNWRLEERREQWFTQLAEGVEELREQVEGISLDALVGDERFTDAVVSATRTVEHTCQAEKISALRNAVLNSAVPGAPDAVTQAKRAGLATSAASGTGGSQTNMLITRQRHQAPLASGTWRTT
jgi:hypothetical protein